MRYKLDLSPKLDVSSPPITGAPVGVAPALPFIAWQPSTWPPAPAAVDEAFVDNLKHIFEESILSEINNVISDAHNSVGSLEHRGHVVAIALLCALDAISSYGYGARCGKQIPEFVRAHFPAQYRPRADALLVLYRHAMVHSWNLFEVSLSPGTEEISESGGVISFGLLNFFEALVQATERFLEQLVNDPALQQKTLARYKALKGLAKP